MNDTATLLRIIILVLVGAALVFGATVYRTHLKQQDTIQIK